MHLHRLMSYRSCIVQLIITIQTVHGGKIAPNIQKGTPREAGTCTKVKCVKVATQVGSMYHGTQPLLPLSSLQYVH